jgi:hypothetical protein
MKNDRRHNSDVVSILAPDGFVVVLECTARIPINHRMAGDAIELDIPLWREQCFDLFHRGSLLPDLGLSRRMHRV